MPFQSITKIFHVPPPLFPYFFEIPPPPLKSLFFRMAPPQNPTSPPSLVKNERSLICEHFDRAPIFPYIGARFHRLATSSVQCCLVWYDRIPARLESFFTTSVYL